jgi:hydroxymethylpyrimidine/phosphomethylpyrimidine kinase
MPCFKLEVVNAISTVPVVLTIAGSDSSAGAGIQADLKSIAANGGYGINALTSVVSETPGNVSKIQMLPTDIIEDQIRVLFAGFPIAAVKTGMLGALDQVQCVVRCWRALPTPPPLVVDPVMVATGGGRLLEENAVEAIQRDLLPLATVITPNMDEAAVLWGRPVEDEAAMLACAKDLHQRFGAAVLVKGGHLPGDAADVLISAAGIEWFRAKRVQGVHTHGTGCSYSAGIATGLAKGLSVTEAVRSAKAWLSRAIEKHLVWTQPSNGSEVHALNHLEQ